MESNQIKEKEGSEMKREKKVLNKPCSIHVHTCTHTQIGRAACRERV